MFYVYASILILLNSCFLLVSLAGVPGNWVMIGCAVLFDYLIKGDEVFHLYTLIAVVAMAVVGELIELTAGAVGAKKFGGTKRGSLGALGGGVFGAVFGTFLIPIPIIGTIAGAVIGAFSGATLLELTNGRPKHEAVRAGQGAALGHITGNLTKFAIGGVIWLTIVVALFR